MIGLDTNIVLRAILNDDAVQSPLAQTCLKGLDEQQRGYISLGVILELYWVFDRRYRLSRQEISETFGNLLKVRWLEFESFDVLVRALDRHKSNNIDLSDALIAGHNQSKGCTVTVTFDKSAAKASPFMSLLT